MSLSQALNQFAQNLGRYQLDTEATETPASWATSAIVTLFLPRTVTTLPDFAGDTKTTPLLR